MLPTSWRALGEEMKLDMQRIWKRNLGRDDRCISDNGKEVWLHIILLKLFSCGVLYGCLFHFQARFPFLDEDVIATLLEIPLWEIADLDQPSGKGDKRILREVTTRSEVSSSSLVYLTSNSLRTFSRLWAVLYCMLFLNVTYYLRWSYILLYHCSTGCTEAFELLCVQNNLLMMRLFVFTGSLFIVLVSEGFYFTS